ncbi:MULTISPECIES: Ig-like domain-containing protein [unclassified Agrococcus]|uniref:Ig-like domain-containing protein n=1 Tax=unclassified Agrococcus TaxID=2615065 RepID=UPI0036098DB3
MSQATRIGGIALGGALAIAVATAAALWPGNAALDPRLDPGSVWVANGEASLVGAVNTQTDQLESIVAPGGAASEVVQGDGGVLVVDRAASVVRALDRATLEPGPAVLVPSGSDVQLAGSSVAIVAPSSGDVWVSDVAAIESGDELGEPVVQLGRGAVAALTPETLFAASPGLGRVLEVDVESGETRSSVDAPMSPDEPALQITAVGDRWVLLDTTSSVLSSGGWQTRIEAEDAALQLPGPATGRVLVATETGIEWHELGVQTVEVEASGLSGSPSRPLLHDGCAYGAWSSGSAWRGCDGDGAALELEGVESGAELELAAHGGAVVLADAASGDAWTVAGDGTLVDDWTLPTPPEVAPGGEEPEEPDAGADDPEQLPPVAVDDELGARPGQVTLLPVLENDSDPNGDELTVIDVRGDPSASIAPDGRSVRLALPADAAGSLALEYRISDGAGGEATATATVEVRGPEVDEPPAPQRPATIEIAPGETVVADAFQHWVDPDGDALVLMDASSDAGDLVRFRPDGRIEITDGGAGTVRDLAIAVSDGTSIVRGSISLTPVEQPPLVAGTVTATTRVGQTAVLEPLLSARGGAGLELHNVNGPAGVVAGYVDDTISVTPETAGIMTFTYVVSDGAATATGQVRVQVLPAVDASTPPQPTQHAVGVLAGDTIEVPVADLDVDPAGGVLVVTGARTDSDAVRVDVVDQERVRIELAGPLEGQATVRYGIANGVASAEGVIVVVERDDALQAPIARDDAVRVQPGGAVDVPVLANDEHPDGASIELAPALVEPAAAGLAFVDGDRLRYVAPDEPGEVSVTYEILGPDGQSAFATVAIVVADSDAATNVAPTPPTVDARVVAGETVDIPIDLTTADPNGDGVSLVGLATPASLGSVAIVDGGTLRYEAGGYSAGTETLSYVVADDLGAQATGVVRIGVAALDGAAAPPIAEPDVVTLRPGTSQTVDVLANDLDPAGLALDVVGAVPQGDVRASVQAGEVLVTAGDEEGESGVVVTIESSRGAQAVGWLRVVVDEEAEPPTPRAQDVRVPVTAILDREQVVVEPLDAVTIADGAVDQLEASLPLDVDGVAIDDDGSLRIPVRPETRVVPYTVTRADTGASASALVVVPGTEDALPQLRPDAPPIVVASGETIEIDIDDHVVAVDGDPVVLTDASSVRAEHSDGAQPVVDSRTLRFTSAPGFFGFASIAFEVTDGDGPGDPEGRVASVVLPIVVEAGDGLPGRVLGTTVQLEQGVTRELDLARITSAPNPDEVAGFSWSIGAAPEGFSATVDGSILRLDVAPDVTPGTVGDLEVQVTGPSGDGAPGTLQLLTISSTKPLAQPQPDRIEVVRGQAGSVDLLANDEATNPFPGDPLQLVALDEASVPLGVAVTRAPGSSVVTVSASEVAQVGTTTVRYQVVDATNDPRRAVWSTLTIVVRDVPDRPAPPVQATDAHVDGGLVVRIVPPGDGNSPILGYTLVGPNGYRHECGPATTCTLTDLPVGEDVRLQVVARNAVGASAPSAPSEPMHADRLPSAVTGVSATPTSTPGTSVVRWAGASTPAGASAITGYLVRVQGPGVDAIQRLDAAARSATVGGLQPGQAYRVDVAATNDAGVADAAWRWSTPYDFTAVGPPGQTTVVLTGWDETSGIASVSWAPPATGGAALQYRIGTVPEGQQPPACAAGGGGRAETSGTARVASGERAQVVVIADNGYFCSSSVSQVVYGVPGAVPGSAVSVGVSQDGGRAARDVRFDRIALAPGMRLQVLVPGQAGQPDAWAAVVEGQFVTPQPIQTTYGQDTTVQIRQCAANGNQLTCGPASSTSSVTPLALAASATQCSWGAALPQQLRVSLPVNGPSWRASATVQFRSSPDQAWSTRPEVEYVEGQTPVPFGSTEVRVQGEVASSGLGGEPFEHAAGTVERCGM